MKRTSFKIFILFCLLINSSIYLEASAAVSEAKNSRLQSLLKKAKQRRSQQKSAFTAPIQEQAGVLPADISRTKDVVYEETTKEVIELNKSVPKQKNYDELVDDFNNLFEETKSNIEEHKEPTKKIIPTPVQTASKPYIKERPKTVTKTTARPPEAIKKESTQVKVETKNNVTQTTTTTSTSQSKVQVVEVEDLSEETELEEDEFYQEEHHGFDDEDEEEAELDEDEGLQLHDEDLEKEKSEAIIQEKIKSIKPASPKDKAARDATSLDLIKKALKSLEEDAWNEVKFNMGETLEYFDKQRTVVAPSEIDKFHKITLAFLRFAEGGLELDQGDFADFEDAEAHYLDSQDILDAVELKLNSKNAIDKELLQVIQTVKKYINEDIEYIEEMIDLS